MTRLVGAELLKLRTTWGVWVYLVGLLALVALAVAANVGGHPDDVAYTREDFVSAVSGAGVAGLFALLVGLVGFTTEFRHGTMPQTFLATPVRERVLAAKAIAFALVGLLFAVLALGLTVAIAVPWLRSKGIDASLGGGDLRAVALGMLAAAALWGGLGVAVGAVVRNQAAAVAGVLVWFLIAENLLGIPFPDAVSYLPGRAADALAGDTLAQDELSRAAGGLVTLAWTAGALAVAALFLRRHDVA